jgi:hypothetical protein
MRRFPISLNAEVETAEYGQKRNGIVKNGNANHIRSVIQSRDPCTWTVLRTCEPQTGATEIGFSFLLSNTEHR